jgi:hypothetical protein
MRFGLPRRFPFALAFRRPALTRATISERSSSATAPAWLNAFDSYVKLLTSTIIAHTPGGRAVDWKPIFHDAVQFWAALEESDHCASWYAFAFGRVGKSGEQPSADEYKAFREALSLWGNRYSWPDQGRLDDRAEQMVRHIVRLAPREAIPELSDREKQIAAVIRRGAKGTQYCRELDNVWELRRREKAFGKQPRGSTSQPLHVPCSHAARLHRHAHAGARLPDGQRQPAPPIEHPPQELPPHPCRTETRQGWLQHLSARKSDCPEALKHFWSGHAQAPYPRDT